MCTSTCTKSNSKTAVKNCCVSTCKVHNYVKYVFRRVPYYMLSLVSFIFYPFNHICNIGHVNYRLQFHITTKSHYISINRYNMVTMNLNNLSQFIYNKIWIKCMRMSINYGSMQINSVIDYYKYKVFKSFIKVQSRYSSKV